MVLGATVRRLRCFDSFLVFGSCRFVRGIGPGWGVGVMLVMVRMGVLLLLVVLASAPASAVRILVMDFCVLFPSPIRVAGGRSLGHSAGLFRLAGSLLLPSRKPLCSLVLVRLPHLSAPCL